MLNVSTSQWGLEKQVLAQFNTLTTVGCHELHEQPEMFACPRLSWFFDDMFFI